MKANTLMQCAVITASLVGMAACASDDNEPVTPDTPSGREIRFAANTEYSRSGDITTNNLKAFNVYAYTGTDSTPKLFMDNVTVTKTASNVWTYSPVQYWPSEESVDFYAYAPAGWLGTATPLTPVAYDAYPGTEDIVYAVNPDLRGAAGQPNAQVVFNFRHALAKVTVKMSSTNSGLSVKVSNVAMSNLSSRGNFTFPREATTGEATATSVGTWSDQNTPVGYLLHMSQTSDDRITLTTTPTVVSSDMLGANGCHYLIPQQLSYRSNGAGNDNYIAVMCSIYDSATGTKLWPNENTPEENVVEGSTFGDGLLKFPLSTTAFSAWQPGYSYIYNLVINSNEEMGSIEFGTPTVDTYVDVDTTYE